MGRLIVVVSIVIGTLLISLTIVALNRISSFEENDMRAFTILRRFIIRKNLQDACQKIIKIHFRIYKLKKDFTPKELLQNTIHSSLKRQLQKESFNKLVLKRELNKDNFAKNEDKFEFLSNKVDDDVQIINEHFKVMENYKDKLIKQLKEQNKLVVNLEDSLRIYKQ
jgi:hypothetical protein